MKKEEVNKWFKSFNRMNILVVGDVMIDAYYWGQAKRISPEAPVPVAHISSRENRLGGAANVALNLKTLGANPIICSVIGKDEKENVFRALLNKGDFSDEGIIASSTRITTVKTRIIADGQHLLRVDEEDLNPLAKSDEEALIDRCLEMISVQHIHAVVFEDYDKGVLTPRVISEVIKAAQEKNIPTTVDPKKDHFFDYKGVDLFKPNLKELREGLKIEVDPRSTSSLQTAVASLTQTLGCVCSMVTLSEYGVCIQWPEGFEVIPAHPREIADVSGAGDTVISVATLLLAAGADPVSMASIANLAGGLVCERVGVVPIKKERLLSEAEKLCTE